MIGQSTMVYTIRIQLSVQKNLRIDQLRTIEH